MSFEKPSIERIRQQVQADVDEIFEDLASAKVWAAEVVTCTIAAIAYEGDVLYFRPMDSKDSNIVAYALITLKMKEWRK